MLVAAIYVFAMFSSNESLKYVDYAYQALAKSCKLIPVMIGSILIEKKRFSLSKYASVAAMTAGITAYEFMREGGGSKHGVGGGDAKATSSMGIALLALSLALDGCSGPFQKRIEGLFTQSEQQIASNVWATVYMFVVTAGMGQLGSSIAYLRAHPSLLWTLAQFSVCSGMGQLFIFFTIREFDALTCSTITTTRKFATIVVNAVLMPKDNRLNPRQWGCVGVVFGAVALDMYFEKNEKKARTPSGADGGSPADLKRRIEDLERRLQSHDEHLAKVDEGSSALRRDMDAQLAVLRAEMAASQVSGLAKLVRQ